MTKALMFILCREWQLWNVNRSVDTYWQEKKTSGVIISRKVSQSIETLNERRFYKYNVWAGKIKCFGQSLAENWDLWMVLYCAKQHWKSSAGSGVAILRLVNCPRTSIGVMTYKQNDSHKRDKYFWSLDQLKNSKMPDASKVDHIWPKSNSQSL